MRQQQPLHDGYFGDWNHHFRPPENSTKHASRYETNLGLTDRARGACVARHTAHRRAGDVSVPPPFVGLPASQAVSSSRPQRARVAKMRGTVGTTARPHQLVRQAGPLEGRRDPTGALTWQLQTPDYPLTAAQATVRSHRGASHAGTWRFAVTRLSVAVLSILALAAIPTVASATHSPGKARNMTSWSVRRGLRLLSSASASTRRADPTARTRVGSSSSRRVAFSSGAP
jgi:hypothetical protein